MIRELRKAKDIAVQFLGARTKEEISDKVRFLWKHRDEIPYKRIGRNMWYYIDYFNTPENKKPVKEKPGFMMRKTG